MVSQGQWSTRCAIGNLGKVSSAPRGSVGCCSRKSGGSEKTARPIRIVSFFTLRAVMCRFDQETGFGVAGVQEFKGAKNQEANRWQELWVAVNCQASQIS